MKKNIMIFMLLLFFLVGVFGAVPVKAETDEYTFQEWCSDNGFNCQVASDEDWSDSGEYFVYKENYEYILSASGVDVYLCVVHSSSNVLGFCFSNKEYTNIGIQSLANSKTVTFKNYKYSQDGWHFLNGASPYVGSSNLYSSIFSVPSSDSILFTSVDIFASNSFSGVPIVSKSFSVAYSFEDWCSDAGLNCVASSNETEDLYDFTFNSDDYYYIVRRNRIAGSKYTLYLSQVTKEEDLIYYSTNRALADSKIGAAALYVLSGEYASGNTNICNYVYDSSGGGWLYTDNYGVDLGLTNDYFVDDIGISFSSSMPIVYSSTDIYSDKEQSSVYYAADTEFEDPFVVYPNISPTSTPTPTPISNSGSSDLGGNVVAGGGIDFIISIVSQFWSRVCSIPMYVDGFQINLQQMYVYGILAGIVGGAIVLFTRRK